MTRPCHACGAPAGDLAALCALCAEACAAPPFTRAGGDCLCACGRKYYDHARDRSPAALGYDGSAPLTVLCDGRRVKL